MTTTRSPRSSPSTPADFPAPRLGSPPGDRHLAGALTKIARLTGTDLMPWQAYAGSVITSAREDGRWLYPEAAIVVSRQNGKTTLLRPRIIVGLLRGERIGHAAQDRDLPRAVFLEVSEAFTETPTLARQLKSKPRHANGQETIELRNGARYKIFASGTGSIRGWPHDTVILDEAREQRTDDFDGSAGGSLAASNNPQTIYVSNAGDRDSVILNRLRDRAVAGDPQLAYLEWSADPERPTDDRAGWAEANPALGHTIRLETLEQLHRSRTRDVFETEHLCRWVTSLRPKLVDLGAWTAAAAQLEAPTVDPVIGVGLAPNGRRVAGVLAWRQTDGRIAVTLAADAHGDPVDVAGVGAQLLTQARAAGIRRVLYSPWTDAELVKHLGDLETTPTTGAEAAAAAGAFVRLVAGGQVVHDDVDGVIASDLEWLERKIRPTDQTFVAVPSSERPSPAGLAAVLAVYGASLPDVEKPTVH